MWRRVAVAWMALPWGCTAINGFDEVVQPAEEQEPPVCAMPCKLSAPQCGCAADQMCDYVSGVVACVVRGDDAAIGQACTPYGCAPGLHCIRRYDDPGVCHAWCDDHDDCDPDSRCLVRLSDGMEGVFEQQLCSLPCDPLTGAGCNLADTRCQLLFNDAANEAYTSCSGYRQPGTDGAPCNDSGDCGPAHYCSGSSNPPGICRRYCDVAADACPTGQSCVEFSSFTVIDGVVYGLCLPSS